MKLTKLVRELSALLLVILIIFVVRSLLMK